MPMTREAYETLLNELNNPELEHSRRTEVLSEMRADYSGVLTDFQTFEERTSALEKDNNDLILSNSKLFRQIGVTGTEIEEEVKEKEFSETITLEEIEAKQGGI
jgi:hypothetical protein